MLGKKQLRPGLRRYEDRKIVAGNRIVSDIVSRRCLHGRFAFMLADYCRLSEVLGVQFLLRARGRHEDAQARSYERNVSDILNRRSVRGKQPLQLFPHDRRGSEMYRSEQLRPARQRHYGRFHRSDDRFLTFFRRGFAFGLKRPFLRKNDRRYREVLGVQRSGAALKRTNGFI